MISRPSIDFWLLLMTLLWGANYTIVKATMREVPPHAFNALRLVLASLLFLAAIRVRERRFVPFAGADLVRVALVGVIGHFIYQICFVEGLAHTSVANSSLLIGCSPVVVALVSAAAGHERIGTGHWAGALLSVLGIYLVVGRGAWSADGASARLAAGETLSGDLLMLMAVGCWTAYTISSRGLLTRHSALSVTGVSMMAGTLLYLPLAAPSLLRVDWPKVSAAAWGAVVYSAVFSLGIAYLIWYTAVQSIGNARTSMYSNMVPISAMIIAVVWLREPIGASKLAGAGAILGGLVLTRIGRPTPGPPEE